MVGQVISAFESNFKGKPRVFVAPGRINLIGEHTDYNMGLAMPAAIDKHFVFAIAPNNTDSFLIKAIDLDQSVSFSRNDLKHGHSWENYLMGVIDGFLRRGKQLSGADSVFSSNIPAGAGLSSSAALCSGFGFALNEIFKCGLGKLELAVIAQEAEQNFTGTRCGIMDMYASLFSEENSVMLLDCRDNTHGFLPARFEGFEILLIDTKVKHSLASSGYNSRRAACEEGVLKLSQANPEIKSLRDVSPEMLESSKLSMSEEAFKRCTYVVREIDRTKKAAHFLQTNDLVSFGKLMYETHLGLSREYEVSCAESDWLVDRALKNNVTGARQMGGGFGGCTINLIPKGSKQALIDDVSEKYFNTFKNEPDFYSVKLASGVHEVVDH